MQTSVHGDKFSYVAMKDFARFMTTYNMVSQAVSAETNVYDIDDTGTQDFTMNGLYVLEKTIDPASVINTEQAAPTSIWAANVAQVVDDEVYTGTLQSTTQMFWKCIKAHTTSGDKSPHNGQNSDLWEALPNADEMELADDFRIKFLITSLIGGELRLWIASAQSAIGTEPTLKIPYYDPSVHVAVGIVDYANDNAEGTVTFGESGGGVDFATDGSFINIIGPCLPHPDNMPKN